MIEIAGAPLPKECLRHRPRQLGRVFAQSTEQARRGELLCKTHPIGVTTLATHLLRIRKLAVSSLIVAVSALRFFFGHVLHRPTQAIEQALPRMKKPILRPKVYSVQELERLLGWPQLNRKHRALFMTTYAAGLRVSEVCQLRLADLLSDRHQIHVVQGKGKKDRYTLLSPKLLDELRGYWRRYRPQGWLFPSPVHPGAV